MNATQGRSIGGVRDQSAPTEIPLIWLKVIIGGGRDTSLIPTYSFKGPARISQKRGWNREYPLVILRSPSVILSAAKDLTRWVTRSFAGAQDDKSALRMTLATDSSLLA